MTDQEIIELIGTKKAALLLGQIGKVDRPLTLHSRLFPGTIMNPMGALTSMEDEWGLHIWIPVCLSEVEEIKKNPPCISCREDIERSIMQAMRN